MLKGLHCPCQCPVVAMLWDFCITTSDTSGPSPRCLAAVLTVFIWLLQKIARAIYSNPPLHGALLVSTILNDEKLKQQWFKVCATAGIPGVYHVGQRNCR